MRSVGESRALHELTGLALGAAIAAREVSPVEVTEHLLARAEAYGERLGAYVTLTADLALEQAAAAEKRAVRGELRGPLDGVPVPVKDLNHVQGQPVAYGSTVFAGTVAPFDDHVVTRLRAAGTVCLGKTSTPEMGLPCYTEPDGRPPARTPWDLSRSAGGSSGGAGAVVGAGLAPLAQGSDGGGSIRIPASVCGVVGLKTSRGRVSSGPLRGDGSALAVNGPLGRTVADVAALLDVMAGPTVGDPWWAPPLPDGETFLGHARREPGRLRIARFATPVVAPGASVHPEVLAAYELASRLLEDLGHEVVDVEPPFEPDAVATFETVWRVGAASVPVAAEDEERLTPLTRHLRALGREVAGPAYALAVAAMHMAGSRAVERLAAYDAVLTPTLADLPAPVGGLRDDADPAADFEAQKAFTPFTALWNVTGMPAVSLPLHHTGPLPGAPRGLPVGVMLAGRPAGDAPLLALAGQVEQARPWEDRRPPDPQP